MLWIMIQTGERWCNLHLDFRLMFIYSEVDVNPLNAELNPICHLLALLESATIVVVSSLRVKVNTFV